MALAGTQFFPVAQEAPGATPRPFGLNGQLARQTPPSGSGLTYRLDSGYCVGGMPEPDPVLYSQRSGSMPSAYAFADLFSSVRASTSSYYDALGNIRAAAQHVPCFTYDPLTLKPKGPISQKGSTNYCNTRSEGAVVGVVAAGNSGAFPAGMGFTAAAGLTVEVTRIIPAGDASIIELRASGIANSTSMRWYFGLNIAAAQNDWFAGAAFVRTVQPAATPPLQIRMRSGATDYTGPVYTLTRAWQRMVHIQQFAEADPLTGRLDVRIPLTVGQAYDFTWQFYLPSIEKSPFVSYAPQLPAAGAPTTAVTRLSDLFEMTDLSKIAFNPLAGTFVIRFWIDAFPVTTSGVDQLGILRTSHSTLPSFMRVTALYNGRVRIEAGAETSLTLDSPVNQLVLGDNALAFSYSQDRVSLSVNGNDVASVLYGSTTPASAANSLRLGDMSTASTRKANGPISLFDYDLREITGDALKALSAAALRN